MNSKDPGLLQGFKCVSNTYCGVLENDALLWGLKYRVNNASKGPRVYIEDLPVLNPRVQGLITQYGGIRIARAAFCLGLF